ncbi:MAG TPA: NADPH-dependent FMN reductase [Candidatus Thermoplasmatota archaeon]|nr:NADPH-dependent FMN reductase [Candidatus Thermoplasmatota archaeon]
MSLYLPVIHGTVRAERRSFGVARFVASRLARRPGVETRIFDPRDLPFGNLVATEWEMDPRPPEVDAFVREMARADGFVLVAPEYNHGIPGALKNVLDALYDEWGRKPFGLVGVGGVSGGLRAVEHLRPVISGLGAVSVPAHVAVQQVTKAFNDEGPVADAQDWERRVDRFLDEVAWYARALKAGRAGAV